MYSSDFQLHITFEWNQSTCSNSRRCTSTSSHFQPSMGSRHELVIEKVMAQKAKSIGLNYPSLEGNGPES